MYQVLFVLSSISCDEVRFSRWVDTCSHTDTGKVTGAFLEILFAPK